MHPKGRTEPYEMVPEISSFEYAVICARIGVRIILYIFSGWHLTRVQSTSKFWPTRACCDACTYAGAWARVQTAAARVYKAFEKWRLRAEHF